MKLQQQFAKDYILAGNAVVTFLNVETGNQHTYRVRKAKGNQGFWYVGTGWKQNVGRVTEKHVFQPTDDPLVIRNNKRAIETFDWVWRRLQLQTIPEKIHILREDACGQCGRPLTEAASIITGIGPECRKKLGIVLPPDFLLKNQPQ